MKGEIRAREGGQSRETAYQVKIAELVPISLEDVARIGGAVALNKDVEQVDGQVGSARDSGSGRYRRDGRVGRGCGFVVGHSERGVGCRADVRGRVRESVTLYGQRLLEGGKIGMGEKRGGLTDKNRQARFKYVLRSSRLLEDNELLRLGVVWSES